MSFLRDRCSLHSGVEEQRSRKKWVYIGSHQHTVALVTHNFTQEWMSQNGCVAVWAVVVIQGCLANLWSFLFITVHVKSTKCLVKWKCCHGGCWGWIHIWLGGVCIWGRQEKHWLYSLSSCCGPSLFLYPFHFSSKKCCGSFVSASWLVTDGQPRVLLFSHEKLNTLWSLLRSSCDEHLIIHFSIYYNLGKFHVKTFV